MGWNLAADFPDRIRDLRETLGMTQAEMANLFGVGPGQVSSWERGVQRPHKKNLRRWAHQYNWPLEIFAEGGPMPSSAVSLAPNSTLEAKQTRVTRILKRLSWASGGLSRASRLLAEGSTEEAEAVLRRVIRVEDYDEDA